MTDNIDISIITPSYNMLSYLQKCAASIGDQEGGRYEHIVIDGGSTDGTAAWLARQKHIRGVSEKDNGMYDAINKGLRMAKGNILAYLNCDEQYLPGTLGYVKDYFEKNPDVDMIFGDLLLIRPDGTLVAYRKGYRPRWHYIITSHLYVLSCTMFFRREIVEKGFYFDTGYRAAGDAEFVVRVLRSGINAKHVQRYQAAFTMTGKNLGADEQARRERKHLLAEAPFYIRIGILHLNYFRLMEKFFSGAYFQKKPLEYSVYVQGESRRKTFRAEKPGFRWRYE